MFLVRRNTLVIVYHTACHHIIISSCDLYRAVKTSIMPKSKFQFCAIQTKTPAGFSILKLADVILKDIWKHILLI